VKVLLFITGYRQVKEYDYFNAFLQRLTNLNNICDIFIYCNNPDISEEIVTYYKKFSHKNKRLYITSVNAGFGMGGVEAVSSGIEMGIFNAYDYVIHLHPDVFITDDSKILEMLNDNIDNDYVFLVNKSLPDDERFFSFDFFAFKPRLLKVNIFKDEPYRCLDLPEHCLCDAITRNNIKFKIIDRFDNSTWFPRRIDDHLKLYHEHNLGRVENVLRRLQGANVC
jgi:hypothetical protein